MHDLDRYLDLYRVGDAVQKSVSGMRVGPETGFFNPPFPVMYSGLNGLVVTHGLGAAGQPLPQPYLTTLADGYVAPPATWLQTALNAAAVRGGGRAALAVDGVAGSATLEATRTLWRALAARSGVAVEPQPYLVTVGSNRTVAMPPSMVAWIIGMNLIEVAPPRPRVEVGPVELDPLTLPPSSPPPSPGGGGALLLVAAVVAGVYFSR